MKPFLQGFVYAFQGIAYVLQTQRNARVHALVACAAVVAAACLRITPVEWAILALTVGFVFSAEMLNTVTELTVDLVSPQFDRRAKAAKDAGAGAVLVAALAAIAVGIAIFGPRLWALLTARRIG